MMVTERVLEDGSAVAVEAVEGSPPAACNKDLVVLSCGPWASNPTLSPFGPAPSILLGNVGKGVEMCVKVKNLAMGLLIGLTPGVGGPAAAGRDGTRLPDPGQRPVLRLARALGVRIQPGS